MQILPQYAGISVSSLETLNIEVRAVFLKPFTTIPTELERMRVHSNETNHRFGPVKIGHVTFYPSVESDESVEATSAVRTTSAVESVSVDLVTYFVAVPLLRSTRNLIQCRQHITDVFNSYIKPFCALVLMTKIAKN